MYIVLLYKLEVDLSLKEGCLSIRRLTISCSYFTPETITSTVKSFLNLIFYTPVYVCLSAGNLSAFSQTSQWVVSWSVLVKVGLATVYLSGELAYFIYISLGGD